MEDRNIGLGTGRDIRSRNVFSEQDGMRLTFFKTNSDHFLMCIFFFLFLMGRMSGRLDITSVILLDNDEYIESGVIPKFGVVYQKVRSKLI